MRIQSWNYLDTVEAGGSIPSAPISYFFCFNCLRRSMILACSVIFLYKLGRFAKSRFLNLLI